MKLKTIGKNLITEPVSASLIQGENGVNRMEIHTPRTVDGTDLAGYVFKIRGNDSGGGLVEQVLEKDVKEAEIILFWEVSARFTALSGKLSLELLGINPNGGEVVKFSAADITIRETLDIPPAENPTAFEQALNDISVLQATKLSAENIIAGANISVAADGNNVTISSSGGGGGALIDDNTASADRVYSSAKLERDFAKKTDSEGITLPVATADTLGGIKVGRNLTAAADGTLSAISSGGGGSDIDDSEPSLVTVYSSAKVEADFAKKTEIPISDVDKAYVDEALGGKADAAHSHSEYLTAESIAGLGGDMLKSVYDADGNGIVDNAEKVCGFTVGCNVPADAKFSDTTYEKVSADKDGLCPQLNGNERYFLASDGEWRVPPDTDTTYGGVSTDDCGLCPPLNGNAEYFLSGDGTWKIPAGGGALNSEQLFSGSTVSDGVYTTSKPMTGYKAIVFVYDDHQNWFMQNNLFLGKTIRLYNKDYIATVEITNSTTFSKPRYMSEQSTPVKLGILKVFGIK